MARHFLLLCFAGFIVSQVANSQQLEYTLSSDSLVNFHASNRRVYTTTRLTERPRIDGKLDDYCWQNEGYWDGDFIQQQPHQGHAPSQRTIVKILYDDDNLYVAIKCYDTEPERISRILGRRDDYTSGDVAGIAFDTYYDKTTAFEFNVTAAGQKIDLMHKGAYDWDTNWDAVWEAKSHVGDSVWTVEMRIPFSQLRFSDAEEQVWGMHIWRWIDRLSEESQWKLIPIDAPAMVYIFGELHGLKNIKPKKNIEIMPFATARQITDGLASERLGFGVDGKIGLSSNFTLDFTVMPDFGQVEADPSVLNLTSYEVFYDEKRPFFLEGTSILDYSAGTDMLFYTRRIGNVPSYAPPVGDDETLQLPMGTTILNALKLTGKNSKGFSLGVVNSMTSKEYAFITDDAGESKIAAEPFTNYFAGRVIQDINQGNTVIGGMFTSALRSINDDHLNFLPDKSLAGGIDFRHHWLNRKYFIDLKTFYSNISGSTEAISLLQRNARHMFHRVDAEHLSYDPELTTLEGWGGQLRGGKQSGKFRATGTLNWRSPGVELNDLGYLRNADLISQRLNIRYQVNQPKGIIRGYYVYLDERKDWNFGGENLNTRINLHGFVRFTNLWSLHLDAVRNFGQIDTRQLRGGPSLRTDPFTIAEFFLQTNSARKFFVGLGADKKWVDNQLGGSIDYTLFLRWNVSNRFSLTSRSYYENLTDYNQYVAQRRVGDRTIYIVGKLDRKTAVNTFRAELFATPELSFQYYGSPYITSGKYLTLSRVDDHLSNNINNRYTQLPIVDTNDDIYFLKDVGATDDRFAIYRPDFTFTELRSNFVLRWEYRPGSTLYAVWTHNRSSYEYSDTPALLKALGSFGKVKPENAIMLKLSYWFSL